MKDETAVWLDYAHENLKAARILLDSHLFNSCLQNIQQYVEKALKSLLVEHTGDIIKTHSILILKQILLTKGVVVQVSDEECDLLDTIYLPSKYPLGGVIPDYNPDEEICRDCLEIAYRLDTWVNKIIQQDF